MKLSAVLLALVSLVVATPTNVTLSARQSTTYTDYLGIYFTGECQNCESIYMAVTNNNNPASWTALNGGNLVLQSNVGTKGVRDPSLIRSPDGSKFWIIATDLNVFATGVYETENGSKGIVVWSSNDLKTWSAPTLRTISPSNAGMTWAPDAIWDSTMNQYMVFWTCALKGDGWYIMKSYTSDFVTFSTAQKYLSGAGMDATIALDKSTNTFYRISKNGPGNLIEEASATSLAGSWRVIKDQIGSGTLPAGEGPLIFQNNQNPSKWHLFIDDYTRGRGYAPFETTNIAQGNWVASTGYSLPQHFRHGYVIPITSAQRSCLTGGTCSASSGSSGSSGGSTSGGSTGSTGSSSGTVAQWGQCGGIGYTGPTTCVAPYKCTVSNAYYSQCI